MGDNTYYGDFSSQEKSVLETLPGNWVFWKVVQGKRSGFYAWNHDWPKDNRIVAGDFVEFHNSISDYLRSIGIVFEESTDDLKPVKSEYFDSKQTYTEPTYYPVGMKNPAESHMRSMDTNFGLEVEEDEDEDDEDDDEFEQYSEPSGPQVSWEDLHDTNEDDFTPEGEEADEDQPERKPASSLRGADRISAMMEELSKISKKN